MRLSAPLLAPLLVKSETRLKAPVTFHAFKDIWWRPKPGLFDGRLVRSCNYAYFNSLSIIHGEHIIQLTHACMLYIRLIIIAMN